jgi:hypothetical protein
MTTQKHWLVSGYRVFDYGEALELAQVVANRTGLRIAVMEKLDSFTPYYIASEVYPNI